MSDPLTGQVVLDGSGAGQLPEVTCSLVALVGHPSNSNVIWVGNDGTGTVSSGTGYPLVNTLIVSQLHGNLNEVYVYGVSGEKLCWMDLSAGMLR